MLGEIKNFSLDKLRGSKLNNQQIAKVSKKQIVVNTNISIALIKISTQEIIAKENIKIKKLLADDGNSNDLIDSALYIMADELVSKLLLSMTKKIQVIAVQDNELVLNKGSNNGIKVGMSFDIYKVQKIQNYDTQKKYPSIRITRVDKKISFGKLKNIKELPTSGNIAKYVENNKNTFLKEKIRIAIGETIIDRSNVKNNVLINFINRDMEHAFNQNKSFIVTNNAHANKVLAQQILDELSKGREMGLPLGSLRGVDYLVFNTIDYLKIDDKKIKINYLESIRMLVMQRPKIKVQLSGYVYLVDVNTSNKIASVAVTITQQFSRKNNSFEVIMKQISQKFTKLASQSIFNEISPTRIIKINGMSVLLNAGKSLGIEIGSIYKVFSKGEMITDNHTGQSYQSGGMPIAKIRINSFNNQDEAIGSIIEGSINQIGLEIKLDIKYNEVKNKQHKQSTSIQNNNLNDKNRKKNIVIRDILIDETISKYKHKYLKNAKLNIKIKQAINKSKIFKTISRDKNQIRQLMMEKQLSNSDISDDFDSDKVRLSLADYILIPKITRFKLQRISKKIEYIDNYENKDYIEIELSLTLMDIKGEIIFDDLQSAKYTHAWTSQTKLKNAVPLYTNIYQLTKKVVNKSIKSLINNKSNIVSDGLLTVMEVGKFSLSVDMPEKKDTRIGDIFYVYPEPKMKTIKRTGKQRLVYGSRIAEVKIDNIFDDSAEAIVIKGDINDIKENYILRKKTSN